jgi:5'-deoxynucleotidase
MYKFFAYLNRMKYIKRWSLMRSVCDENIQEHSQQVAIIAHALALIAKENFNKDIDASKTVLIAQYHEVGEVITGDLPTPIKYFNPEIKTAYKDLEEKACKRILNMLPENLKGKYEEYIIPNTETEEYKLVKYADRIAAYIKCIEEIKAGNSEFKKAKKSIEAELKASKRQEVAYYLKEFAPAFDLTLDELD